MEITKEKSKFTPIDLMNNGNETLTKRIPSAYNSHGVKFSLNMTSDDKQQLLMQFEEWRRAKRENIAARYSSPQKKQVQNVQNNSASFRLGNSNKNRVSDINTPGNNNLQSIIKKQIFERSSKAPLNNINIKSTTIKHPCQNKPIKKNISNNFNCKWNEEKIDCKNLKFLGVQPGSSVLFSKNLDTAFLKKCFTQHEVQQNHKNVLCSSFIEKDKKLYLMADPTIRKRPSVNNEEILKKITPKENIDKNKETLSCDTLKLLSATDLVKSEQDNNSYKYCLVTSNWRLGTSNTSRDKKMLLLRPVSMLHYCHLSSVRVISEKKFPTFSFDINRSENFAIEHLTFKLKTYLKNVDKLVVNNKRVALMCPKGDTPISLLRDKLGEWLNVNGHQLEGFRLLSFGELEDCCKVPSASYISNIPSGFSNNEHGKTASQQHISQCENWLKELHNLIALLKYPPERCEEWLLAIRKKYPMCTQLCSYWECITALNNEAKCETRLKKVADKESEVDHSEDSLVKVFDRMTIKQETLSKTKLEKGLNPQNIFNSTVIKFSLQQKTVKEFGTKSSTPRKELVATPVRRSSRIHTPNKNDVLDSLQSLAPEVRKKLTFKTNESLLSGI